MKRHNVDSALRDMLASVTTKNIGMSQVPAALTVGEPYAILYQSPSPGVGEYDGSWADPEDCRRFDFLVKSVGRSHRQAAWMSTAVNEAIMVRSHNGWVNALSPSGLNVIDRSTVSMGAIVRTGEDLFEVNDIYRLKVTK